MIDQVRRDIVRINSDLVLSHQVTLGSKTKTKTRIGEYFAKKFKSQKYKGISELSSLTVAGSDFFVLTGKNTYTDTNGKLMTKEESIFISYPHLVKIKLFFKEIHEWLVSDEYADMYVEYEEAIVLSDKYHRKEAAVYNLPADKTLKAFPTVICEDDVYYEAVGLELDNKVTVYVTADEMTTLLEIYSSIDLYTASLCLMSLKNTYNLSGSSYSNNTNYSKQSKSKEAISKITANRRKRVTEESNEELDLQ